MKKKSMQVKSNVHAGSIFSDFSNLIESGAETVSTGMYDLYDGLTTIPDKIKQGDLSNMPYA